MPYEVFSLETLYLVFSLLFALLCVDWYGSWLESKGFSLWESRGIASPIGALAFVGMQALWFLAEGCTLAEVPIMFFGIH